MSHKNSGKDRKLRRRARRQLQHTYDYEKDGMQPAEAKAVCASEREAPEPRDGELFSGGSAYVRQDLSRIKKLMTLDGVLSQEQKDSMLLAIADLVHADHTSSHVKIAAYRVVQQEIQLLAKLSGEMQADNIQNHLHLHGGQSAAKTLISRLERLAYDDQARAPANETLDHNLTTETDDNEQA
jgi:hypothetical protein